MRTLSKPPGLPVFAPHENPGGDCLLARLLAEQPERASMAFPQGFEGGIAHRLDTSTSGAILVADSPQELAEIRVAFRDGEIRKTYLFRAARDVSWDQNVCELALAHDPKHRGRMTVQRGNNTPHRGKWLPARTSFTRVAGKLWRAEMSTGVMHQIRLHAAFVGLPIVGDKVYGGGPPAADAPEGAVFLLHHVGLDGPGPIRTAKVPDPPWAR